MMIRMCHGNGREGMEFEFTPMLAVPPTNEVDEFVVSCPSFASS